MKLCTNLLQALLLTACLLAFDIKASAQAQDKVQKAIKLVKTAYYCEEDDYHTDGQRTVWVKSYKKWTPEDLEILKKENANVLTFLYQAVARQREDVLEQVLPDYYRSHGGVKTFAADIVKQYSTMKLPQTQ